LISLLLEEPRELARLFHFDIGLAMALT